MSSVEWGAYSIAASFRLAAEDASLGTDDAAKLSTVADDVQDLADEDGTEITTNQAGRRTC